MSGQAENGSPSPKINKPVFITQRNKYKSLPVYNLYAYDNMYV
jgi:hypothetical protein